MLRSLQFSNVKHFNDECIRLFNPKILNQLVDVDIEGPLCITNEILEYLTLHCESVIHFQLQNQFVNVMRDLQYTYNEQILLKFFQANKNLESVKMTNIFMYLSDVMLLGLISHCPNFKLIVTEASTFLKATLPVIGEFMKHISRDNGIFDFHLYRAHGAISFYKDRGELLNAIFFREFNNISYDQLIAFFKQMTPTFDRIIFCTQGGVTDELVDLIIERGKDTLKSFDLAANDGQNLVTLNGFIKLITQCNQLTDLRMRFVSQYSDDEILELFSVKHKLTSVSLMNNPNITTETILKILQDNSKLTKFDVFHCEKVDVSQVQLFLSERNHGN